MKRILIAATLVSFITVMYSCGGSTVKESDVPAAVVTSFKAKYPAATNTEWKTEKSDGKDVYEAMFKLNGNEVEAEFLPDGTFYKEE